MEEISRWWNESSRIRINNKRIIIKNWRTLERKLIAIAVIAIRIITINIATSRTTSVKIVS